MWTLPTIISCQQGRNKKEIPSKNVGVYLHLGQEGRRDDDAT